MHPYTELSIISDRLEHYMRVRGNRSEACALLALVAEAGSGSGGLSK